MEKLKSKKEPQSAPEPAQNITNMVDPRGEIFQHFWAIMMEKQSVIDGQIEQSDIRFTHQMEAEKRLMQESDRKFFSQMHERNKLLHEEEDRIFRRQMENSRNIFHGHGGHDIGGHGIGTGFGAGIGGHGIGVGIETGRAGEKVSAGKLKQDERDVGVIQQFYEFGLYFNDISSGGRKIFDESGHIKMEIDLMMEGSNCIMAVAICAKPKKKNIETHIGRLDALREHRNRYQDSRRIHGAIMGKSVSEADRKEVLDAGLFLIEQSGDGIAINTPKEFAPREW